MFTSKFRASALKLALGAILGVGAAGCDDPTATRLAAPLAGIRMFLIVDPDQPSQPLLIKPADEGGSLANLRVEIRTADGQLVSTRILPPEYEGFELQPCIRRYGSIVGGNAPYCLDLEFAVRKGEQYEVRVLADDQPTATARFTVPGAFSLLQATADGGSSAPTRLDVQWTPSAGAYRYLVAVRPTTPPPCVEQGSCQRNWFAATTETSLVTTVPGGELDGAAGPYFVDVYAVDRAIYEYMTSGVAENLFPVSPVQNVEGGRGAAGAWVRQSRQLP